MPTIYYTARVQENGSLELPEEARETLNLKPGDEIQIQFDAETSERERDLLREAIDVGLDQLERGEYSVYTADTIQDLADEVKAEGRNRLRLAREKSRK